MLHRSLYKVGSSGIDLVSNATDKTAKNAARLEQERRRWRSEHMRRSVLAEFGPDHIPKVVPPPHRASAAVEEPPRASSSAVETPVEGITRQRVSGEPGAPWVISGLLQYSQGARKGFL